MMIYLPMKAGEHWLFSSLIYPFNLMIFDSDVSLPEGTYQYHVIPRHTDEDLLCDASVFRQPGVFFT